MPESVADRIKAIFTHAAIIDDDFDDMMRAGIAEEAADAESAAPGRVPAKQQTEYKHAPGSSKNDTSRNTGWPQETLGEFAEAGILPIPFLYEERTKEKIKDLLSISSFAVIDYYVTGRNGSFTGVDIIKDCLPKEMICPVVLCSRELGVATAVLKDDVEFEKVDGFDNPPCFRLSKSGIFVLAYNKEDFYPAKAIEHIIAYVSEAFECYSILAMEFYSRQRDNLRAVLNSPFDQNLDSSLMVHAILNDYDIGDLRRLLSECFFKLTLPWDDIDSEPIFLKRISSNIGHWVNDTDDNLKKVWCGCLDHITSWHTAPEQEKAKKFVEDIGKAPVLRDTLKDLGTKCGSLAEFVQGIRQAQEFLEKQIGLMDKEKNELSLKRLITVVVSASQHDHAVSSDFVRHIRYCHLLPNNEREDIWKQVVAYDGNMFTGLTQGECLKKPGSAEELWVGKVQIKGEAVLYCITPACDVLRPPKVSGYVKFVHGIDCLANDNVELPKVSGREAIHVFNYLDEEGKSHSVILNFGNVESLRLPDGQVTPNEVKSLWEGWVPYLRLHPQYAYETMNKYIAYQSRAGVESIDW